tara:strand:- start:49 stop:492 length:444 start_codon:yes stop_codon:yes gene_type:complete
MRSLFNKYVFNLDWRRTGKMPTVVKLWRSIKDTVYYHCYYKHTKKHKQDLEDVSARVLAVRDRVLPHLTGSTPTNTKIMNEYEEKANAWQEATDNWVKLTLEKYDGYDINDLTQVFMRGPFAGWSERMVVELAMGMDDANKKVPRHK